VALQGDIWAAQRWLLSGLSTAALTHLLKFLFNFTPLGERPDGNKNSFPSGHTSIAIMGAVFFHLHFGFIYAIVPYLLAGFTGFSRIYAKRHWLRDVIAGALLAFAIVYYVLIIVK
jgi:membrane-associated phospholipid phosphatase